MTPDAGPTIRTEDLRKTYKSSRGDVPAVRGIDLSVESGQFFGLLGPNGAGKSTTIGMLTTLVLPTGGRAWVAGKDVVADPVGVKRRIGVVTQNNTLDMQLTVAEIMAVTFPLVMEFSWQRTIEDRALAPVPIKVLAIQKITAGAVQSFIGACIVFPIVLLVHAAGQAPHVHVTNWGLFALILVFASLLTSSLGLLLGTIMDPRKMQMLFAVILLPATMLGCVYYPWAALHHIRWLQIAVLVNPMVYMSEGLRAVLTPSLEHMPMWAVMLGLVGGTVVFGYLGTRTFTKRVLN